MSKQVPFIGRAEELTIAKQLLLEFGVTNFLFLVADGGIGKTRFLEEFGNRIRNRAFESSNLDTAYRITVVQEFTDSEWSSEFQRGIHTMAQELGIHITQTDAEHSADRMASDLAGAIAEKPDAIIVSLGSYQGVEAQIQQALAQNIPVLTFDNYLKSIEGAAVKVFQEDLQGIQQIANPILKEMNYTGKLAIVWTQQNKVQKRRVDDLRRILLNYNQIELLDVDCELNERSAESSTEQTIVHLEKHPDTKAIWCVFDEYARGVIKALKALKRTDIKVYSLDLCPSDRTLMLEEGSPWQACAAIDPAEAGRLMVRLALQEIVVTPTPPDRYHSIPLKLVTQKDLRQLTLEPDRTWYSLDDRGWSSELRAIVAHRQNPRQSLFTVAEVIDFADPDVAIEGAIEQRLAALTGQMMAPEDLIALLTLEERSRLLQHEATERQHYKVQQALIDAINQRCQTQRLVLCFDTTERATQKLLGSNLIDILCQCKNLLVIFAGRPEPPIMAWLIDQIKDKQQRGKIIRCELPAFDATLSRQYLQEKQQNLAIEADDEFLDRLAKLALGKPILLDLVIEYIYRNLEFDPIPSYATLEAMDQQELHEAATAFESNLVQHIRRLQQKMDLVVLRLSRIYPLSQSGLATLFKLSENEAASLFAKACTYAFIRIIQRSDSPEIELHDEMRRLIEHHFWPIFDPDKAQRRRDSQLAYRFYQKQDQAFNVGIKAVDAQLRSIDAQLQKLETQTVPDERQLKELEANKLQLKFEQLAIRRRRQTVTENWVKHMLFAQQEDAFEQWVALVEKVRSGRHYPFIERLCKILESYRSQLSLTEQRDFDFYYARTLLDLGQTSEATQRLEELLVTHADADAKFRSNIYNQLGVAYQRTNQLTRAIENQQQCLDLIDSSNLRDRASVLNQIGYYYRLLSEADPSRRNDAQVRYEQVIALAHEALPSDDEVGQRQMLDLIASTNNNRAFLYGMSHDYDRAEILLQQALATWRRLEVELQDERGRAERARAEITLGILARERGRYETSRQHLERAITLIPRSDTSDKPHQAYFQLGWTEWFDAVDRNDEIRLEGLERAARLLERSRELAEKHGLERDLPGIYHQWASVVWRIGMETDNEECRQRARQLNQTARDLSERLQDHRYYVDSWIGEAEFDFELKDDSRLDEYVARLAKYEQQYFFPLYYGRLRRIRAEFALLRDDLDEAFALFTKAIHQINEYGGVGPYRIEKELQQLSKHLQNLPYEAAQRYLQQFRDQWAQWQYGETKMPRYDLVFWCEQELLQLTLQIMNNNEG
ncbi:substrate-binding domain-containing protein [Candidatus Chloroploca sp. M-50]|uniref:Substrate-binding domain-containing protein n=1 Tax=Candidatus Chloroploca mongolica TaxID=2528176 RepID=A0ABS4DF14_9CHLR|nr:substrate-binding domain-containing protein [Candidatus Chloroploca mongolica]MBP1467954.1 substrate-binding domain-containing protein [Candidatus Chloroploca mongolica]